SGGHGRSRLAATGRVLFTAGARAGSIFGRLTDRELYAAILAGDTDLFVSLADELAEALAGERIDTIVGDAVEGFNSGHDVGRLIVTSAWAGVGPGLHNYACVREAPPHQCPLPLQRDAIHLELDEPTWQRKLAAARGYPQMEWEVDRALAAFGFDAFRHEW